MKPVALIIRDGWGENHEASHNGFNAVKLANTPVSDHLSASCPRTEIMACGPDVGLPEGVMGNSEVGHQNLGAGRIVDQEIVRITKGFKEKTVQANKVLQQAFQRARSGGKLHLMGLISDAGVHAMLEHLYGILELAKAESISNVYIHAFTDGRDTGPFTSLNYIKAIEEKCAHIGIGAIASVCGRFWSMDRDQRWDRIEMAYNCLTARSNERTATSASEAVQAYYDAPLDSSRKGDEFVLPTQVRKDGKYEGAISDGDALVFFNFRGDRPREITRAFIDSSFSAFDRGPQLDLYYATMTEYQKGLCENVIFTKPPKMDGILGGFVSEQGIAQFRCAETEKYPHVTFFFNDYREEPFEGEDRAIIQSPKDVSTYDQKPEMSAPEVCEATVNAIQSGKYGLIVVNFANPDMVGHTGNKEAAMKACETVDACVGKILEALKSKGGIAVVTADHGNADQMWNPEIDGPHTAHTLNPVEVVIAGAPEGLRLRDSGRLGDIAPTLLELMELTPPKAMTGQSLILK